MDLKEIQDFIKAVAKSGVTEVKLETEDIKISVKTPPKGKAGLQTETTVVQQIPVPSHLTTMPPIQMTQPAMQTTSPGVPVTQEKEVVKEEPETNLVEIKAPMVGTYYKRPAPDKPNYVNVGDQIEAGQVICIIEAMKLFNEIEAEVSGKVVKILLDDSSPVEFDQPLFLIEPK